MSTISDGVFIINETGQIEGCNASAERILGSPCADLVGKTVYERGLPEHFHKMCEQWLVHHLDQLKKSDSTDRRFEVNGLRANGTEFPMEVSVSVVSQGSSQLFIVTFQDLTKTQEMAQLKEEAKKWVERESLVRRLVTMINESLDLTVILDTAARELGQFLQVDRAFVMRYNYCANTKKLDIIGQKQYCANETIRPMPQETLDMKNKAVQLLSPETLKQYAMKALILPNSAQPQELITKLQPIWSELNPDFSIDEFLEMIKQNKIQSTVRRGIFYNGILYGTITLHQCTYPREWTPDEIDLVNYVSDQLGIALSQADLYHSEQLARQEAELANRRKSEFLGMMSHELRTPLNAIIGFSDMTLKGLAGPLTEKQTTYLKNVNSSGRHLLDIVNDLLDVSQVETGQLAIYPVQFELKLLLETIQTMMQEIAAKSHVKLVFKIDPSLNTVTADPARFKQILINLLNNAIKFNRKQGSVFLRLYPSMVRHWFIGEVEDTGIGIPKEKQAHLFTKFYQVDARIARTHEGTGLGLALAKELVERHGGEIQVNSIEGQGSTFIFKLPLPIGS
jgi:PAS domain S-box-containing protein